MAAGHFIAPVCLYFFVLYLRFFLTPKGDFTRGNYQCTDGFNISSSLATLDVGSGTFLNITRLNRVAILKSGSPNSSTFAFPRLFMHSMMILRGDIEVNPGPKWRFPCGVRKKPVKCNQKGLQCDRCDQWYHTRFCSIDDLTYNSLADTSSYMWICSSRDIPNFSSSLLSTSIKAASNSC